MGMNDCTSGLSPAEEAFLQALLWEEGHLLKGPATRAAQEHGLSLLRCLEPANRLSPNLHGEALNRLRESPCPAADWPWANLTGHEVLRLLWNRLAESCGYKKYTESARRGIKGESFFESLIVDHAIPHRIARENDLGVDFLCEWIHGDHPTGILFSAQVKSTTSVQVKCEFEGHSSLNGLDQYTLGAAKRIDERTIDYWKGLGLPAFLFYVVEEKSSGRLNCYFKRYTPFLDGRADQDDQDETRKFYKVNDESKFLAFADFEKETWGFARDLVIDYFRLSYFKGHLVQLTQKQLGFWPFPNKNPEAVPNFPELIGYHRRRIQETCEWTAELLAKLPDR